MLWSTRSRNISQNITNNTWEIKEYGLKNNQKSRASITILVIAKMLITVSGIHVCPSYYFIYWRTRSDPPVVMLFARCFFLLVGPKYGWAWTASVQSVEQHNAQCSWAASRCVMWHDMETGGKQGGGWFGGGDMAAIPNCVVGLLKCDASNVKLSEGFLLVQAAISNCVLGLLISYANDIKPRFGFAY